MEEISSGETVFPSLARAAFLAWAVALLLLAAGCTDMKDQPRYKPYAASPFFGDGSSARPLPEGTVARGHLDADTAFYDGVEKDGSYTDHIPLDVDAALLARGQERFNIYCSPCHDRTGSGYGMIVRRGYKQPPSYHIPRLRGMPPGYFYSVISNGFGVMSSYAAQVHPRDRWAIVAYIRALQLSEYTEFSQLPADVRAKLDKGETVDIRPASGEEEEHESAGH